MVVTLHIDDELFERARAVAGPCMDESDICRVALETFVRLHAERRLAALGGKAPGFAPIPRDRPDDQSR